MTNTPATETTDELVRSLVPRLYRTAFYLTRNENDANDAVQETLTRLVDARTRGERKIRKPLAWSLRVLVRLCIARRQQKRRVVTGLDLTKGQYNMVEDRRPEDELEAHELRCRVRESVGELPPDEREAVTLHVFGELTVREIARTVGVSRSTAHERIRRGLERLARRLHPALRGAAPGAPLADLAEGLRSIPGPPIPESLAAAATQTLASVTAPTAQTALASTTLASTGIATGGIIMTKGTVALLVTTGILAVASLSLGVKLKTMESELARTRSAESNRLEQLVARQRRLELANVRLRDELARLGRAVPADKADDETPEQRDRAVDDEAIWALLRQAEDAFATRDAAAFRDSFLALLDAGPLAHGGLIELLRLTGNYDQLFGEIAPDDYDFRREFLDEVSRRRSRLGTLADAILTRDGEPDGATLFAYDLLRSNGVVSERPLDEQAATFLSLLERALDSEDDHFDPRSFNIRVLWPAELLGKTGLREALPELGELLTRDGLSEDNQIFLARSVARLGGSAAVDLLRELHDSSSAATRGRLMGNVAMYDYGDPEVESFLRELGETSPDANVQSEVREALDRREEDLGRLVARLDDDAASTGRQRMEVINTLLRRGDESQKEAAWAHFERAGDQFQDEMLASIANFEERALELLLERFDGDRVSRELAGSIVRLDTKLVHANRERIARAAGDVSLSLRTRAAAAVALGKLDPDVAVRALTPGFEAGSEAERVEVVETIKRRIGGAEAAAFLDAIVATDASERVRAAARR